MGLGPGFADFDKIPVEEMPSALIVKLGDPGNQSNSPFSEKYQDPVTVYLLDCAYIK